MSIRDMVARHSDFDETADFIPTPPWATRALYEYAAPDLKKSAPFLSVWDPACGQGHMLGVFDEYKHPLIGGSDINPDVLHHRLKPNHCLWEEDFTAKSKYDNDVALEEADVIITNPPYKHLNRFIEKGLENSRVGLGLLVRVQSLEGEARSKIYLKTPPTQIAFFANRIPFKTGAVVQKAPKMFFHVWLWWSKTFSGVASPKPPMWIPFDSQARLEKDADYGTQ